MGRLPREVEEGLWDGVARGLITADGFNAVRSLLNARTRFARRQRVWFQRDPRITWVGAGDDPMVALPALHTEIGALGRA